MRVAPNVANLPLRPPAVLAQAVASLDILSDGRAELGLGAGAFWDAVVAAGGPRRSPGEAVEALEEAIAVIRGVWGVDGGRTVDVDGQHYRVKGMHAGPPPVHDISIWLGALKPRMLRLTGRLADGWLPSLGRVTPDSIAGMNAVIDEAAEKAGRGAQSVRRMLNIFGGHEYLRGTPAVMAERLAALTLDHGTSTFILGSDDPDELQRFAAEVVPAVRDLVDRERAGPPPVVEVRGRGERRVLSRNQRNQPAHPSPPPPPDDGTRLSAALPWDETTRPTYAGPDDAPYQQPGVPQHLVDIHDHLRSELATVRDLVDQVRRGARERRRRAVGRQHHVDAPEQLDPRRLLRVVLPDRHRPPHAGGPQRLHPPALAATPTSAPCSTGSRRSTW